MTTAQQKRFMCHESERICKYLKEKRLKSSEDIYTESTHVQQTAGPEVICYRTPQSAGKAIKKVRDRLPMSPNKRKFVLTSLAAAESLVLKKTLNLLHLL
jgi:hypothetical protein